MDGFPSLEVIGVMETNSYIYSQGRGPCSSTALRAKATVRGASIFTVSSSYAQEAKQKVQPANQLLAVLQTQSAFLVCTRAVAPNT